MQLTTLMDRLRARSLHQASWMCLSTSLSAVSPAVLLSSFQFVVIISELLFEKKSLSWRFDNVHTAYCF